MPRTVACRCASRGPYCSLIGKISDRAAMTVPAVPYTGAATPRYSSRIGVTACPERRMWASVARSSRSVTGGCQLGTARGPVSTSSWSSNGAWASRTSPIAVACSS